VLSSLPTSFGDSFPSLTDYGFGKEKNKERRGRRKRKEEKEKTEEKKGAIAIYRK